MDFNNQPRPTADDTDEDEDIIGDWIDSQRRRAAVAPQSQTNTHPVSPVEAEQPGQ